METNLQVSSLNNSQAKGSSSNPVAYEDLVKSLQAGPNNTKDVFVPNNATSPVALPISRMSTAQCHTPPAKPLPPINLKLFLSNEQRSQPTQEEILEEAKRICKLENINPVPALDNNNAPSTQLLLDRAAYNLTRNPDYLTKHLPIKRNLQKINPKKLEEYENLVQLIMNNSKMCYKSEIKRGGSVTNQLNDAKPLDNSTCYFIAASIVELFHNRPDVVKHVMERRGKVNIVLTDKILKKDGSPSDTVGFHKGYDNSLVISGFWDSILLKKDSRSKKPSTSSTVQHEFVHVVDGKGKYSDWDGILFGITEAQKERFTKIRDEMVKKFEDETLSKEERTSGLPEDAFEKDEYGNYCDFPTYGAQMFCQNPERMRHTAPKLYNWLIEYFRFDPFDLKQDAIDDFEIPISKEDEKALIEAGKKLEKGTKVTLITRSGKEEEHVIDFISWKDNPDGSRELLAFHVVDRNTTKIILFMETKQIKNIQPSKPIQQEKIENLNYNPFEFKPYDYLKDTQELMKVR